MTITKSLESISIPTTIKKNLKNEYINHSFEDMNNSIIDSPIVDVGHNSNAKVMSGEEYRRSIGLQVCSIL